MGKINLNKNDFEKFDAYLEQYAERKLQVAYEKAQQKFKREWLEKHRVPPELKAKNDARMKKFMADVASGAPYTKPIIENLWASVGTIVAPSSEQQLAGWGLSTPPESYFFNWFYNMVETFLGHINQFGICLWDNQTEYPQYGLAMGSDGQVYRSKIASNVNNNPVGDSGENWQIVISDAGGGDNPVGSFLFLAYNDGQPVPHYLDCLGQPVSRETYAALFAKIGTTWGSGDGVNTFTLPPAGRILVGAGWGGYTGLADTVGSIGGAATHSLTAAENGPHTHNTNFNDEGGYLIYARDPAHGRPFNVQEASGTQDARLTLLIDNSGSGDPHNNIQPSMVGRLLIKYQ